MTRNLLVDDLFDPLGWLNSVDNSKSESSARIDHKLDEVRVADGAVLLRLSSGDRKLTAALYAKEFKTLTLSQVTEILLAYRGDFLLCALAH
jgi:hypothetical protein